MPAYHKQSGFTLVETIIYIGLFALIFSGIFVSIYPIFTGAERLTKNVATEGETAFILAKIDYALSSTVTKKGSGIISPTEGASPSDKLIIGYDTNGDGTPDKEHFLFKSTGCTPPSACLLTLSEDGGTAQPLNATRVIMKDFQVEHKAEYDSQGKLIYRYLDIYFKTGDRPQDKVGPVRYYLHF